MVIVLDGCGVGGARDADLFGDAGSDTLGNTARVRAAAGAPLRVPNLAAWGLTQVAPLEGVQTAATPRACHGRMRERGAAKDTTAGHWEMMGLVVERPFPTYPGGFPADLVEEVSQTIGYELIGNEVASGTEIVARLGAEAVRRRALILYTSADSVFQLAAHEDVIPVDELYRVCAVARRMLGGEHNVGRVIARPFVGAEGSYTRTPGRRDFSLAPPGDTVVDALARADVPVYGVGKVGEIFTCRGFAESVHTKDNSETVDDVVRRLGSPGDEAFVFANLGDFDTLWGHRNDVEGFAQGIEGFDERLPDIGAAARPGDVVVITADHGCDPTTASTDHSREEVPLLAYRVGPDAGAAKDLGTRACFCDLGATVAAFFSVLWDGPGDSFLAELGPWT